MFKSANTCGKYPYVTIPLLIHQRDIFYQMYTLLTNIIESPNER
jgi:hypothetical protein